MSDVRASLTRFSRLRRVKRNQGFLVTEQISEDPGGRQKVWFHTHPCSRVRSQQRRSGTLPHRDICRITGVRKDIGKASVSFLFEAVVVEMTEVVALTWYIFKIVAAVFLLVSLAAVATALTLDAAARWRRRRRGEPEGRSGIYAGRVWHARFKPTAHRFTYPIFYCLVDLDELDVAFPW